MAVYWGSLLVTIFSQWRESEGMQNWVHFPSDPTQLWGEMRMVLPCCLAWITHGVALLFGMDNASANG
jgi:hypothetical protein